MHRSSASTSNKPMSTDGIVAFSSWENTGGRCGCPALPRFYRPARQDAWNSNSPPPGGKWQATGEVAFYPSARQRGTAYRCTASSVRVDGYDAWISTRAAVAPADTALYGFGDAETWGTWSVRPDRRVAFAGPDSRLTPPDNVEVSLDAHPFLAPDADVDLPTPQPRRQRHHCLDPSRCFPSDETRRSTRCQVRNVEPDLRSPMPGAALEFEFPGRRVACRCWASEGG